MLVETLGLSKRLACKAVGLARSTYARIPVAQTPADPDAGLRAVLRTYAREHPLHGFRRAWAHLRHDEGVVVNKKKVHRLWKEEGLQVRIHHPRKRAGVSSTPQTEAVPDSAHALRAALSRVPTMSTTASNVAFEITKV